MKYIWYVSSQRLCNFQCNYCVSTGDWAKSNSVDWFSEADKQQFFRIIDWIASASEPVGLRLGSLGEPLASKDFLAGLATALNSDRIEFVEILTNAALVETRLKRLSQFAPTNKLSLWSTYHPGQIEMEKFLDNLCLAQASYGCFVVANILLWPGNETEVSRFIHACRDKGLKLNVDLGYNVSGTDSTYLTADEAIPAAVTESLGDRAARIGMDGRLHDMAEYALDNCGGQQCYAGDDYFFIAIDGAVYPCSRYCRLRKGKIGVAGTDDISILDRKAGMQRCGASHGCANKEDFLNMRNNRGERDLNVPSLGILRSTPQHDNLKNIEVTRKDV